MSRNDTHDQLSRTLLTQPPKQSVLIHHTYFWQTILATSCLLYPIGQCGLVYMTARNAIILCAIVQNQSVITPLLIRLLFKIISTDNKTTNQFNISTDIRFYNGHTLAFQINIRNSNVCGNDPSVTWSYPHGRMLWKTWRDLEG